MWMGPGTWYPGPKLGGGGCEYTGAMGGCEYGGGGAVGAFCPGNVLKGGCISDCCELVAPLSRKLVTSAFITRPPAPEPGTLLRSSPCSCATLRPTGVERTPFASAAEEALPASSRRASGPPTVTTAPSFASCSTSTPVVGEGISVLALSVAISTSGSSRSTFWPVLAIQRTTVPSITDSPSCGITTVVISGRSVNARLQACQTGAKAFRTGECTRAGTAPRPRTRAGQTTALDGGARRRGGEPAADPLGQPVPGAGATALARPVALPTLDEIAARGVPGLRRAGVDLRLRRHRLVLVEAAGDRSGGRGHYGARGPDGRAVPGEQDAAHGRAGGRGAVPCVRGGDLRRGDAARVRPAPVGDQAQRRRARRGGAQLRRAAPHRDLRGAGLVRGARPGDRSGERHHRHRAPPDPRRRFAGGSGDRGADRQRIVAGGRSWGLGARRGAPPLAGGAGGEHGSRERGPAPAARVHPGVLHLVRLAGRVGDDARLCIDAAVREEQAAPPGGQGGDRAGHLQHQRAAAVRRAGGDERQARPAVRPGADRAGGPLLVRDALRDRPPSLHRGGVDAPGTDRCLSEQRRRPQGAGAADAQPRNRARDLVALRAPLRPRAALAGTAAFDLKSTGTLHSDNVPPRWSISFHHTRSASQDSSAR